MLWTGCCLLFDQIHCENKMKQEDRCQDRYNKNSQVNFRLDFELRIQLNTNYTLDT